MTATASPILRAACEKLVELLQTEHGHDLVQDGTDDSGYFAILSVPAERFLLCEALALGYMLSCSGDRVRLEVDAEGCPAESWNVTDPDLLDEVARYVDRIRVPEHRPADAGDKSDASTTAAHVRL